MPLRSYTLPPASSDARQNASAVAITASIGRVRSAFETRRSSPEVGPVGGAPGQMLAEHGVAVVANDTVENDAGNDYKVGQVFEGGL